MRRALVASLLAASLLGAPAVASAQDGFTPGVSRLVSRFDAEVAFTGAVRVEFRGDEAAGCAAAGVCGIAGTVTWSPGERGHLGVSTIRTGRRNVTQSFLFAGGGPFGEGGSVSQVTRTLPDGSRRLCTDAGSAFFAGDRPGIAVGLEAGAILSGRCAGPRARDIAAALPVRRLTAAALRRSATRVDLGADAPFTAGGLTGTVRSTVALDIDRVRPVRLGAGPRRSRPARRRERTLRVSYAIERVTGSVRADVAAVDDPRRCDPLDACGLSGSLARGYDGDDGTATLYAAGRASRTSRGELRAAVGLAPGDPGRIRTVGFGTWRTPGAAVVAELSRDDGTPPCRDRVPVEAAEVELRTVGGRLEASLAGGVGISSGPGTLRTRCPGGDAFDASRSLAKGSVPLRALRGRTVTIPLSRGDSTLSPPLRVTTRPDVTIVMRRTSVVERVR